VARPDTGVLQGKDRIPGLRRPVTGQERGGPGCQSSAAGSSAAKGGLPYGQLVEDLGADLASELVRAAAAVPEGATIHQSARFTPQA
jgi:hypothetical protein